MSYYCLMLTGRYIWRSRCWNSSSTWRIDL